MINPEVTMAEQIPTVGRVVHYVSHGSPLREDGTQAYTSTCRAAIITETRAPIGPDHPFYVALCVLNPTGLFFHEDCEQDEAGLSGGSWHWPERV